MNGDKTLIFKLTLILVLILFSLRLFYLQVYNSDYRSLSEENIVHLETVYPSRGIIVDRNDSILVENKPSYDFYIIPRKLSVMDTSSLLNAFSMTKNQFKELYFKAKNYSSYRPSLFYKDMSHVRFAEIQTKLYHFKGIYHISKPTRSYPFSSLSHSLGYVAEINNNEILRDTSGYYKQRDLIGKSGIEKNFENDLRGIKGVQLKIYDVRGNESGRFNDGNDDLLVENGDRLKLSIDIKLQQYIEKLLKGKVGSVVAIEPKSGEILAIASAPSFDPNILTGKDYSKNYRILQLDTLKPIYNRALMATYPPGSMFKLIQGLIGLEENVVDKEDKIFIDLSRIGDLAPSGIYDLNKAIVKSSNNYFYILFRKLINQNRSNNTYTDSRIGLNKWSEYVKMFGLGSNLNFDITNINSGFIPSSNYYDRYYGSGRWKFSNIYSLSIGQGELLVTPIQMANFASILANRGYYYNPSIVTHINNFKIENRKKHILEIEKKHFDYVVDAMENVVASGSGRRGYMKELMLCGKTSTVENPHGYDHSGFIGFAPKINPKIAIAAYIENAGWGGRAATSISSLASEYYIFGETKRVWLEDYVLKGDFIDEED